MRKIFAAVLVIAWTAAGVNFAAEETWTGKISDNLCHESHTKMATGVFPPLEDPACVLACVQGGGKYGRIFVEARGGRIFGHDRSSVRPLHPSR